MIVSKEVFNQEVNDVMLAYLCNYETAVNFVKSELGFKIEEKK